MNLKLSVTRKAMHKDDIFGIMNETVKPINMIDGESPESYIARIYTEIATSKCELETELRRLVMVFSGDNGSLYTTQTKREVIEKAKALIAKIDGVNHD